MGEHGFGLLIGMFGALAALLVALAVVIRIENFYYDIRHRNPENANKQRQADADNEDGRNG